MLQSMTGYGKAEINLKKSILTIEVKSLNSKQIDTHIKMPSLYKENEIKIRTLIAKKLHRGKIELLIWREKKDSLAGYVLNTEVLKEYHKQVLLLKKDLALKWNFWSMTPFQTKSTDIIPTLLKMPDVIQKNEEKVSGDEWNDISKGIDAAISDLLKFRLDEGKKLEEDIASRIKNLAELLNEIAPYAKERIGLVKKKLTAQLKEINSNKIDEVRFEQELIYYLEKQDITEEQTRLNAHLNYFTETMAVDSPNGKKLGFICQEIGREINTIGSKSSNVDMQKIVVEMKDELEKIKEQLLNIL